jgi:hypothetical protein
MWDAYVEWQLGWRMEVKRNSRVRGPNCTFWELGGWGWPKAMSLSTKCRSCLFCHLKNMILAIKSLNKSDWEHTLENHINHWRFLLKEYICLHIILHIHYFIVVFHQSSRLALHSFVRGLHFMPDRSLVGNWPSTNTLLNH